MNLLKRVESDDIYRKELPERGAGHREAGSVNEMIWLNGEKLVFETYPNGETRVDGERIAALTAQGGVHRLAFKYEDDGDLVRLLFVKSHLDERRAGPASLELYYMPYSRMDRTEGDSVFTLKYAARLINAMNFAAVIVMEPHSDVTPALLERSRARYPALELLRGVMAETGFDPATDYLFFPDAGAQKRYGKVRGYRQLVGHKARNFATGRIERLEVVGDTGGRAGFKAIIVDDLCSYGGTFLLAAERLRELGAAEVYLLVTHCEPSIHKGKLAASGLVNRVFTTDTMLEMTAADDDGQGFIKIYPVGGLQP